MIKRYIWRLALVTVMILAGRAGFGTPPTAAQDDSRPYWPTDGWQTSTPEEQGIDSVKLANMLEFVHEQEFNIHSIAVVRHSYLVLDAYLSPFTSDIPHSIHSCTKSFTSTAIGILIDQGKLEGVEQRIVDIFGDRELANMDEMKAAITLEDMLHMASGLDCRDSYLYNWQGYREMAASDDWVQYVLDLPMRDEPGTRFEYCNGGSHTLSGIVTGLTGMSTAEFLDEHVFMPLGIHTYDWPSDPNGISIGAGGMRLTTRDMAKFGYLFLNRGQWEDRQIVSPEWVDAVWTHTIPAGTLNDLYGYQWWVDEDGYYMAEGYAGQYIAVLPEQDMVVVFTSGLPQSGFFKPQDLIRYFIIPAAVADEPLPENPGGVDQLEGWIETLANPKPQATAPLPEAAHRLSGQVYTLASNSLGIDEFTLTFEENSPEAALTILIRGQTLHLPVGLDGVFRTTESPTPLLTSSEGPVALRGRWTQDTRFVMDMALLGFSDNFSLSIRVNDDNSITIHTREQTAGDQETITGTLRP